MRRLLRYTTFFITRQPFERLVSAHSSKFTNRTEIRLFRKRMGKQIALEQAKGYIPNINYVINSR